MIKDLIKAVVSTLDSILNISYRPERHYMRGPGPKWHETHSSS